MNIEIPAHVLRLIERLNENGCEAFIVGGCVRDAALGLVPNDWDICTDAAPDAIKRCFEDSRLIETGIRHGTVTVLSDGIPVEITAYRVDGEYRDHRRPESVLFTRSLQEDLARRDFTINAIAYHPKIGTADPFGGLADLGRSVLRCVGDANDRFMEDALRILRAIRFVSRFILQLEPETEKALFRHRGLLRFISRERIFAELSGMVFSAVDNRFLPVFQEIIPELEAIDVDGDLPRIPEIQFAVLLKGLDAGGILRRLKAGNALIKWVSELAFNRERTAGDVVSVRVLLRDIGVEAAEQLFILQKNTGAMKTLRDILVRGDCFSLRSLTINGNDLMRIGFSGKAVGEALNCLLHEVIEGTLPNDRDALLIAASRQTHE